MTKRFMDIVIAFTATILLLPLIILIGLIVRFQLGSPILFHQQRPGLKGKPFMIYKFRTMTGGIDEKGELLPDSERLTGFGAFLRSTSLDELPELFNVIKGDMSIVGPRPLLMEYLPLYSSEQARRHEVKPGITGWAQVNGRNAINWEEKFRLDVWYVDNQSLGLDLKILLATLLKVLKREGISQVGNVTMEKFRGKDSNRGTAV
ncbi:MAG TPA: sugar transferase [Thermodesulfovibrionales bacterium]|nr:sugar transferase [Thermodesulfovibrionales bacterium]